MSAIGPRASAGRKVSAPTIRTTETSRVTKSGVWVGNVPVEAGATFLTASEPATASIGTSMAYRPSSIAMPIIVFW